MKSFPNSSQSIVYWFIPSFPRRIFQIFLSIVYWFTSTFPRRILQIFFGRSCTDLCRCFREEFSECFSLDRVLIYVDISVKSFSNFFQSIVHQFISPFPRRIFCIFLSWSCTDLYQRFRGEFSEFFSVHRVLIYIDISAESFQNFSIRFISIFPCRVFRIFLGRSCTNLHISLCINISAERNRE